MSSRIARIAALSLVCFSSAACTTGRARVVPGSDLALPSSTRLDGEILKTVAAAVCVDAHPAAPGMTEVRATQCPSIQSDTARDVVQQVGRPAARRP